MQTDLRQLIVRLAVAVMAADSRIRGSELQALERLDGLGLGPIAYLAEEELERALARPVDIRETCEAIATRSPLARGVVLVALAGIAASDGEVSTEERAVLGTIAAYLGVESEEAIHVIGSATLSGHRAEAGTRIEPQAPKPDTPPRIGPGLDQACRVLRVSPNASRAEIDAAYIRLVRRFDPAAMIPDGTDFVALAIRKLAEFTAAFDALCETLDERSAA
jgi:tellurite resistance protein